MTISEAIGAAENQKGEQSGGAEDLIKDAADLLHAARLLLNQKASLRAVRAIHRELANGASVAGPYTSPAEAEECQRKLWHEFLGTAESTPQSQSRLALGRRVVFGTALLLVLVLAWLYGPDALDRYQWLHQYPDGSWISRYYENTNFDGPAVLRYDVGVNYNFGKGAPARGMPKDRWSARWDTCIVVKKGIDLPVRLSSDDDSRLLINGSAEIEIGRPGKKSATLSLQPGTRHIEVDFVERQGSALIRLEGLNFAGTEEYAFRRPRLEGDRVGCD
ncbi:MAG TPA: PA14 domain-containing protein [Polyangiaceae bacterium]|nr:PA14 domain-containing protein [Polyangiaceae bacterium]